MSEEITSFQAENVWGLLHHHFFEKEGLLDDIEHGRGIKQEFLSEIEHALLLVQSEWERQSVVSRKKVYLLWSVFPRLEQILHRSLEDKELRLLVQSLAQQMEAIFRTPVSLWKEEEALAVLLQQIVGGPSFGHALWQGHINITFFQHLLNQIEEFKLLWNGKQDIPKRAGEAIIAIELLPWSSEQFSVAERHKLEEMKHLLYGEINRCLHE
jgi:hypothetical protein